MVRLMALLVIPALLLVAVACSDDEDDGEPATDTPSVTEPAATEGQPTEPEAAVSPSPTLFDYLEGYAVFRLTVTVDGEPLPENSPGVGAQVNGINCGSSAAGGPVLEFSVASDEGKEGCGTAGATVTFVLLGEGEPGGTEADETGTWDNTQVNELAINFTTTQ